MLRTTLLATTALAAALLVTGCEKKATPQTERQDKQVSDLEAQPAPNAVQRTAAEAAKKVGMTEDELRAVNHIPPHSIIKAGSTLVVPRGVRMEKDVAVEVADHGQVGISPDVLTRRTVVRAGKGESVASLAKKYRLTAASVAEWNKINAGAGFVKGQQVVLYLPTKMGKAGRVGSPVKGANLAAKTSSASKNARRGSSKPTNLAKR